MVVDKSFFKGPPTAVTTHLSAVGTPISPGTTLGNTMLSISVGCGRFCEKWVILQPGGGGGASRPTGHAFTRSWHTFVAPVSEMFNMGTD